MVLTPLRASALIFVEQCGYTDVLMKVKENRDASGPAWDVWVKPKGTPRGKKVGTMLVHACEPVVFGGRLVTYEKVNDE